MPLYDEVKTDGKVIRGDHLWFPPADRLNCEFCYRNGN